MMKKSLLAILFVLSLFLLVACNEPTDDNTEKPIDEIYHTITFEDNSEMIKEVKVLDGHIIPSDEIPIVDSETFLHWSKNGKRFNTSKELVFESFTLVLEYKPIYKEAFMINYYVNGERYDSRKVIEGEFALELNPPTIKDYKFKFWSIDGKKAYDFSLPVYNDFDLKAIYEKEDINNLKNIDLDFYYLNDTHGALLTKDKEMGIARIANLVNTKRTANPEQTVFITGGDMFQGQLISNDNKGEAMVEALNLMKLDAFVLGNHEFDWGIDVILDYKNPNKPGVKADFPILGANVLEKATNAMPKYVEPYTIIEKSGTKIGIIGLMGDGLETSISALRVQNYYFAGAYETAKYYANEIEDQVDMIVIAIHGDNDELNQKFATINKVQMIFNAHRHIQKQGYVLGIPYIESGRNGEAVGVVNFNYDLRDNKTINVNKVELKNHNTDSEPLLRVDDVRVKAVIDEYYEDLRHLYEETLLIAGEYMSQTDLGYYMSNLMMTVTNSVVGLQNSGGTRTSLSNGQEITASNIFQIFPFDNQIIYVKMLGSDILKLTNSSFMKTTNSSVSIDKEQYYYVATNDYIFFSYKEFRSYLAQGEYYIYGDMYETMVNEFRKLKDNGNTHFYLNTPIVTEPITHTDLYRTIYQTSLSIDNMFNYYRG